MILFLFNLSGHFFKHEDQMPARIKIDSKRYNTNNMDRIKLASISTQHSIRSFSSKPCTIGLFDMSGLNSSKSRRVQPSFPYLDWYQLPTFPSPSY